MAHFAEIDDNNTVLRVLVISDDEEHRGHEFLSADLGLGGTWIQTSYNDNIRANYAGPGGTYDPDNDVFLDPKPYDDWVTDDNSQWVPPVPKPDGGLWLWNQENSEWIEHEEVLDEEGNECGMSPRPIG